MWFHDDDGWQVYEPATTAKILKCIGVQRPRSKAGQILNRLCRVARVSRSRPGVVTEDALQESALKKAPRVISLGFLRPGPRSSGCGDPRGVVSSAAARASAPPKKRRRQWREQFFICSGSQMKMTSFESPCV